MAEPHDEGEIPDLGDLAGDLPMEYEGFEPISPGKLSHYLAFIEYRHATRILIWLFETPIQIYESSNIIIYITTR